MVEQDVIFIVQLTREARNIYLVKPGKEKIERKHFSRHFLQQDESLKIGYNIQSNIFQTVSEKIGKRFRS